MEIGNFSASQILRETNFCESRVSKSAILVLTVKGVAIHDFGFSVILKRWLEPHP